MRNKTAPTLQRITACENHLRYVFPAGYRFKRIIANPVLEISEDVYQPIYSETDTDFFRNDWTVLAFRAFKLLKDRIPRRGAICIVGTGGGLDALGVIEIFNPGELVITDLSDAALNQSNLNVMKNMQQQARKFIAIHTQKSFLFNTVHCQKASFDLIYENLPNLPLDQTTKIIRCSQPITASYYYNQEILNEPVPKAYSDRLLSLHWLFLKAARQYLKPDGKVVCSIGGRMDYSIVENMFREAGYQAELIVYDFKRQNESASNLPGYAAEEDKRNGKQVSFKYYRYLEVLSSLAGKKWNRLKGFAGNPGILQSILKNRSFTARQANKEFRENKTAIGHEVYFIVGTIAKT
ncbi:MAG: hypothetical protein P0Y53_03075 [Candidatus Pseudobacter hemicellulosilyticus]|uniref:Uncharacterized protein n=1 Tax=Candidatus Pseudobacter hemicellulosilyticus TaxID=3121375 RepID=A0AAJ6BIP2_9BACT|nr:MAG: hypothetical protein P0Y53_03075 [Pseudobacter sp.]